MSQAHSFVLQRATVEQADALIEQGRIVAVVTIPADFDTHIGQHQSVAVGVKINNLNTDFTNDIRRALPLSITSFYAKAEPSVVSITPQERDAYPQDLGYIPFLVVPILVIGLMVGGMVQAGTAAAGGGGKGTMEGPTPAPGGRLADLLAQQV